MSKRFLLFLRKIAVFTFRALGSDIYDTRTGEKITRALLLPWRGRILILGSDQALLPLPAAQDRITYWRQEIAFGRHPAPDFPRREPANQILRESPYHALPPQTLVVILDHRKGELAASLPRYWAEKYASPDQILLAYGGARENFDQVPWGSKIFIEDSRLRVSDQQRRRHTYHGLMQAVSHWMKGSDFTHVLFVEFDHIPVVSDILTRYLAFMEKEDADVLGHWLARIDNTTSPHWLGHVNNDNRDKVILSMIGTGHFWKREAWEAVSGSIEHTDLYSELHMPTAAHHLGFRVRGLEEQQQFVMNFPERLGGDAEWAARLGAWAIHPVKK